MAVAYPPIILALGSFFNDTVLTLDSAVLNLVDWVLAQTLLSWLLFDADDAHFNTPDHFGGIEGWHVLFRYGAGNSRHPIASDGIEIECSEVIIIVVQGKGTARATLHGQNMTSEFLSLDHVKDSPWLRVTVINQAGKRAWSNPI